MPAPSYIWPNTLWRPKPPPKLVYLDLNHWIALSRRRRAGDRTVLDACQDAVDSGRAVFPLSMAIAAELEKNGNLPQRRRLLEVLEPITGFVYVTSLATIAKHEIETLLDSLTGLKPRPLAPVPYLGKGVGWSCDVNLNPRVVNKSGEDVTEEVRARFAGGPEAFDGIVNEGLLDLNRNVLGGPPADDEQECRANGWRPEELGSRYKSRAEVEGRLAEELDQESRWRRGRLRDVVAANYLAGAIYEVLVTYVLDRHLTTPFPEFVASAPEGRRVFDRMPSFDVAVTLRTSLHRDPHHRWKQNDVYDLDALTAVLPYCDVVATDKEMASHVRRSGLGERLDTVVLDQVDDLVALLEDSTQRPTRGIPSREIGSRGERS